jgi:hypothetical protein
MALTEEVTTREFQLARAYERVSRVALVQAAAVRFDDEHRRQYDSAHGGVASARRLLDAAKEALHAACDPRLLNP